ncbi:hypothetical protein GC089_08625 [Cellulomonas sp. JZ18]|uniref:hypothetical protein n=1 Tax=Cellulomonas sp. JZ18 TaxID=2654191 RepID=UPI0012D4866B|nr:hypothetical protein [Cellulomonas sp. JZ18]QGQ19283.1 hypothetical protein GC089_08625 [Cellulomonas sp. JZ18]
MTFPYQEVELEKDGSVHDRRQVDAALTMLEEEHVGDVLLLVHGWNNDVPAARRMYDRLMTSLEGVRPQVDGAGDLRIGVVGVLWPSIRWADDVAGGGASAAESAAALQADIADRVEDPAAAARLEALVPRLRDSAPARAEYLQVLRALLPPSRTWTTTTPFRRRCAPRLRTPTRPSPWPRAPRTWRTHPWRAAVRPASASAPCSRGRASCSTRSPTTR